MNDLALDPSETRPSRAAKRESRDPVPDAVAHAAESAPKRTAGRARLLIGTAFLGVAGIGAFAAATSLMSGLAGPAAVRRPIAPAVQQSAADWPDLRDGQPALAATPIARPSVADLAAAEPAPAQPPIAAAPPGIQAGPDATKSAPAARVEPRAKPAPALVDAPVVGPGRQVSVMPPNRIVPLVAARPAETVRARTASTAFAALPPEPAAAAVIREAVQPAEDAPARAAAQDVKAPRAKAAALPVAKPEAKDASKPKPKVVADRRSPAASPGAVAAAAPPAEPEETEVLGIRMPTLAATGRRIGAGVEALGDAVKGLPDRF